MRHFEFLTDVQREELFAIPPQNFLASSDRSTLALALGATFYSPGTRTSLAADSLRAASIGTASHVWCLEDAIPHDAVEFAQANVVEQLRLLAADPADTGLPMLFVRVRRPEQMWEIAEAAGSAIHRLTGFVMPKFAPGPEGEAWISALLTASDAAGRRLYGMPVLEHEDLAWNETRAGHLTRLRALTDAYRDDILAVRVGATDLCGLFGIRRDADTTIWDVALVREVLTDVLNTFARRGEYIVSGPVWEHFNSPERMFRPQLRTSPFERRDLRGLRERMVRADVDELLREISLDRTNGFTGKTVIHPSHVSVVNALLAVSAEEYADASAIALAREAGGVVRSPHGGKMNELGPHGLWAEQVLARSEIYGVLAAPDGVFGLLDAGWAISRQAYPDTPAASSPDPVLVGEMHP